jgi:hypothetical protein
MTLSALDLSVKTQCVVICMVEVWLFGDNYVLSEIHSGSGESTTIIIKLLIIYSDTVTANWQLNAFIQLHVNSITNKYSCPDVQLQYQ